MIRKKILILSTYPITNPLHGGQKRTRAIVDYYQSIFNEVKFIAVYHKKFYNDAEDTDLCISNKNIIKEIEDNPFSSDLTIGKALYDDVKVRISIENVLSTFQPDIIQIEQIYPWEGLQKILKESKISPKIIYSSQNIESEIKKQIFDQIKTPSSQKIILLDKIQELETKLILAADLVFAVSDADIKQLRLMGAKNCYLIPNGISTLNPTPAAINHWINFKVENDVENLITFVGSAHPPNLKGFMDMVGLDLSFLPPKTKLMLAGGISNYIQQEFPATNVHHKTFWNVAQPLGLLSDDNLAALIRESNVIILPITSGGGSNLKTAEAIISGKKVVATPLAFRSYEEYQGLPNIYIANTADDFKGTIARVLTTKTMERTIGEISKSEQVLWKNCFNGVEKVIIKNIRGNAEIYRRKIRRKLGSIKSKFLMVK